MGVYDDYILQTFYDKNGKAETPKPRQCRICWMQNNFPPLVELEKICNSTYKTLRNYSSDYNWNAIKEKGINLKAQQDQEELKERQRETLEKLDATNDRRIKILDEQVDYILDKLEDPDLYEEQKQSLRKELSELIKTYHLVQNDKLRTVNLPDKINDRQEHKHSGDLGMSVRLKNFLNPDNVKKESEDDK